MSGRLARVLALVSLASVAGGRAGATSPPIPTILVDSETVESHKVRGGKARSQVLLGGENGATKASLSLFTFKDADRSPIHAHTSDELVYVLEGTGRMIAPPGESIPLAAGDAVYVPAGASHAWTLVGGAKKLVRVLVLFAPGGPEADFPKPTTQPMTTPSAAAASPSKLPIKLVTAAQGKTYTVGDGKGSVKILLDKESTGAAGAYAGVLSARPGMSVPEHVHAGESELLFVLSGRGEMTAGTKTFTVEAGDAIHIPPGMKHSFRTPADGPGLSAVQFYAPGGPEQRFKGTR